MDPRNSSRERGLTHGGEGRGGGSGRVASFLPDDARDTCFSLSMARATVRYFGSRRISVRVHAVSRHGGRKKALFVNESFWTTGLARRSDPVV